MHFIAGWMFVLAHLHLRLGEVIQSNSNGLQHETLYNLYGTDHTTSAIAFMKDDVIIEESCYSKCLHTPRCYSFEVFIKSTDPRLVIECSLFRALYQTNKTLIAKPGAKYYSKYLQHEDCLSWYKAGGNVTGVYEVLLVGKYPMQVLCETGGSTIGGGWMVFQKRFDGSVSFGNTWQQYKRGFGYIDGEFWLGNEWLHLITKSKSHDLLVSVKSFDGEKKKKMFKHLTIDSEENDYTINYETVYDNMFSTYVLFKNLKGKPFSTKDRDNDISSSMDCAQLFGGGWWYVACHYDLMNGEYPRELYAEGKFPFAKGICWESWKGFYTSLKESTLMIRQSKPGSNIF